ncbi:MAG: metallophosphoesterase family protein [Bacteroidota bacterium]
MKNKIIPKLLLFILLFNSFCLSAQEIELQFNDNHTFKILQFTDTHVDFVQKQNLGVYDNLKKILQIEKPDLIILTGDIVTQDNPQEAYKRFADIFSETNIPWAMTFGNHDSESGNISRKDLAAFLKTLPGCLNDDEGTITGNSNFVLQVYGKDNKAEALLYMMDSNTGSTLNPMVTGDGWFEFDQINWYRKKSSEYKTKNNGQALPALAFFHIPLPEYDLAWNDTNAVKIGKKREKICCPDINTGMFAAMVKCGDVMGTFVGHDHYNDYIVNYYGIALAYGRASKLRNQKEPVMGGRVIVLKEGKKEFDTWIRQIDGKKLFSCSYPNSFKK